MQEAEVTFIGYAVTQVMGELRQLKALGRFATPGGKSTMLATSPSFDLVLANEVISSRVSAMDKNVVKWGSRYELTIRMPPADFLSAGTDVGICYN